MRIRPAGRIEPGGRSPADRARHQGGPAGHRRGSGPGRPAGDPGPGRASLRGAVLRAGAGPESVLTTVFDAGHDEMVLVRDIDVYATCEHHLIPFFGVAHVGYIPNEKGPAHRALQAGQAGGPLRPAAPGPGAHDQPGRGCADERARAERRHRGDRGRAPVHGHARGAQARSENRDLRRPRQLPRQRKHAGGGNEPARQPPAVADETAAARDAPGPGITVFARAASR